MSTDRNLLLGILALQMDFVTRDQLIAGMNAWVLAKHRPLADVLVEQGALDADTRQLLDALVQKHLDRHGNDPAKSLAALSSASAVRQELAGVADADVQASLDRVGPSTRPSTDEVPRTLSESEAPTRSVPGVRYRILRPAA